MAMETAFDAQSRTGKVWEEMKAEWVGQGKPLKELEKKVDVGYMHDPIGLRAFGNVSGVIEGPEVLGWCYDNKSCHRILIKHGFRIFSGINDYDPNNWSDDQKRHETTLAVDAIKQGRGDDKKELGRGIFDWSLKSMRFEGDCQLEAAGWEAILRNCGACSEGTSAIYFPLQYAGLDPAFYFEADWRPDMRWQDRYDSGEVMNVAHVLTGIKDGEKTVFLDRVNKEFDGSHEYAIPISRMEYEASVLLNYVTDLENLGKTAQMIEALDVKQEMLPDDAFLYFQRAFVHIGTGEGEKGRELIKLAQKNLPNNPAVPILTCVYSYLSDSDIKGLCDILKDEKSLLNQKLAELEKEAPRLASQMFSVLGNVISQVVEKDIGELKRRMSMGPVDESFIGRISEISSLGIDLYARALKADPNTVNAYLGMFNLNYKADDYVPPLDEYVVKTCEKLLEKYPEHTPLHFFAGNTARLAAMKSRDKTDAGKYMEKSLEHLIWVAKKEPDHPTAFLKLAKTLFLAGRKDEGLAALKRVKDIRKKNLPDDYYVLLMAVYFNEGDPKKFADLLRSLVEDRPSDGAGLALNFLKQGYQLSFGGPNLSVELFVNEMKKAVKSGKYMLAEIEGVLGVYPGAQADLEVAGVKIALMAAFADGREGWKGEISAIKDIRRPSVVASLAGGLKSIDGWLTNNIQNEDMIDLVFETLEFLREDLPAGLDERFLSIYVELAKNYIMLDKKDKADRVLLEMVKMDSTMGALLYVQRVITPEYGSIKQKIDALDLIVDHRGIFAPELLANVRGLYENTLKSSEVDAGMRAHIKKQIRALPK